MKITTILIAATFALLSLAPLAAAGYGECETSGAGGDRAVDCRATAGDEEVASAGVWIESAWTPIEFGFYHCTLGYCQYYATA